jgi:hypothetical protein
MARNGSVIILCCYGRDAFIGTKRRKWRPFFTYLDIVIVVFHNGFLNLSHTGTRVLVDLAKEHEKEEKCLMLPLLHKSNCVLLFLQLLRQLMVLCQ